MKKSRPPPPDKILCTPLPEYRIHLTKQYLLVVLLGSPINSGGRRLLAPSPLFASGGGIEWILFSFLNQPPF